MQIREQFITLLQGMSRKKLEQAILAAMACITVCIGGVLYYVSSRSDELLLYGKKVEATAAKIVTLLADNERINQEEQRLRQALESKKDFTIKSFFEQFCQQQGLAPEPGWNTRAQRVSDQFDEDVLPATFRGQTMEKLVKILEALDKEAIVYIKELSLRNENNRTIAVDLTIATKRYRTTLD